MKFASLRRMTTILGTTAGVAALSCALATSASAIPVLTDNGNGSFTVTSLSTFGPDGLYICTTAVSASSCDSSNFAYTALNNATYQLGSSVYNSSWATANLPAGYYNIQAKFSGGGASPTLTNFLIGSAPAPASESVPASVFQAFAAPTSGTCDDAASPLLNWAGVESGSWGRSWQQWVNDGNGGAVCQRTLSYSSNLGRWTIAR